MASKIDFLFDISVDCVIFGFDFVCQELKILIIEQKEKDRPIKVQFALPGDLIQSDESLDDAAERVLKELTNLEGIYMKQFHSFGAPDRVKGLKDQDWLRSFRANPDARVITVAYYSLVKIEDFDLKPSSFAGKVMWIDVKKVPNLAFDHNLILNTALETLREGLVNQNLGFELLPEKFTLGQIQQLYEVVLNKKLDKRNFRKKLLANEIVIPLNEKQKGVLHKPAQLFSANSN